MDKLIELAVKAAVEGAKQILEVYDHEFDVEFKQDNSPLTLADKLAHEAISEVLKEDGLPILSEEGKSIPYETRKAWESFWVVDPLDGTKEFVKRNGEFTVNIALVEQGVPTLGVILVPVTGKLYFAEKTLGAFVAELNELKFTSLADIQAGPLPQLQNNKDGSYKVVCSRSHMSPETEAYIESIRPQHPELDFVSIGSSLKLCLVAEGRADLYPRFGPTMEWDTAAGQAIVEISGGYVNRVDDGTPMRYNKEDLLNPWFIAGRK
jgi:3'(2'), 5'-bisphosphate nucleotidase